MSYIPDAGLVAAIDAALKLQIPLLVTGEPGTGKTELAYYIATEKLGLDKSGVLRFNTKTSSQAKDILYRYDAVRHFRDAQRENNVHPLDYIHFEALGKAILQSEPCVVLIDEIDKAPRDFPNDVLFEFEQFAFRVEEATPQEIADYDWTQKGLAKPQWENGFFQTPKSQKRPVLILTSNSEKNLPDAFLRRCLFYHIPFPTAEILTQIVVGKAETMGFKPEFLKNSLEKAINYFLQIRELGLKKKPATAEMLAWLQLVQHLDFQNPEKIKEELAQSWAALIKNREDMGLIAKG